MQGSPAFDGGPAEPITALTAIAQHTKHVGLIATASTTFYDPYNLARLLASLDQASDGRAGYNAVTSVVDQFALNYSLTQPSRSRGALSHGPTNSSTFCGRCGTTGSCAATPTAGPGSMPSRSTTTATSFR